jgi:hypothetical protein
MDMNIDNFIQLNYLEIFPISAQKCLKKNKETKNILKFKKN